MVSSLCVWQHGNWLTAEGRTRKNSEIHYLWPLRGFCSHISLWTASVSPTHWDHGCTGQVCAGRTFSWAETSRFPRVPTQGLYSSELSWPGHQRAPQAGPLFARARMWGDLLFCSCLKSTEIRASFQCSFAVISVECLLCQQPCGNFERALWRLLGLQPSQLPSLSRWNPSHRALTAAGTHQRHLLFVGQARG
jgi:hypothetical protein